MQKEIQLTKPLQIAIYLTIILILISSVFLFSTLNTDMFGKAVGETCQTNEECREGERCENNVCAENAPEEGTDETGADETQGQTLTGCSPECIDGQRCENGACVEDVVTTVIQDQQQTPAECIPECQEDETCEDGVCVRTLEHDDLTDVDDGSSGNDINEDDITNQHTDLTLTECIPACKETETCENNVCVSVLTLTECIPACAHEEICNEGICETPLGCTDDLNCEVNEVCNIATRECVFTQITPSTKTTPSTIVTQTSTTNTFSLTPSPTPTPTIQTPECTLSTSSKDCSAGFACDNTGKCKTSCTEQTPADCQQGFLCFEGICDLDIIDCMNDNGEPDNTKCKNGMFCSQDYLICIQCDEQHKCAKNFVCSSMGVCQPAGYKEDTYEDDEQEGTLPPQTGLQQPSFPQQPLIPPTQQTGQLPGQLPPEGLGLDGLAGGEQISDLSGEQTYDESADESASEQEPSQELTLSQQKTQQMAAQQQQKLKQEFGAEKGVVGKALTKQANVSILARGKTYWWGIVIFMLIGSLIASLIFMHKRELALRAQSTNQTTQSTTQNIISPSMQSPNFLHQNNMNLQQLQRTKPLTAQSAISTQPATSTQPTTQFLSQQTSAIEQNFVNYVEAQLETGLTKDQVIVQLIKLGWDRNTIQELFTKYHAMFMDKNEREQILNYIRYYTAKGLPVETITSALIKAGWSKEVIESLIKNY